MKFKKLVVIFLLITLYYKSSSADNADNITDFTWYEYNYFYDTGKFCK